MNRTRALILTALLLAPLAALHAAAPTSGRDAVWETADLQAAAQWSRECWEAADPAKFPITFEVEGKSSREFLASWQAAPVQKTAEGKKTRRTFRWTDATSGLEFRVELVSYPDWPVVEWTAFLQNNGGGNSPELRSLLAADIFFEGSKFTLH